ncbi:hypothetical protein Acsp04_01260 [Actinomadura sp. NBRC 104425]|uniref:DUF4247 domain-containing protein n=1 Tax=Actinomadura sp. NBRC 104425 TaxID=3032204 RepID=UPI0024A5850D|nr:DUF4247 domain-containing protein [Actinomadura sp. NBRC 104425]GLZ09890.1 hypothetical protein Acsp04_01260 [Actinomadura sp. NBRC 104425]
MRRRHWVIAGVAAAVVALIVLIAVLARDGGPRGFIADRYTLVAADTYRSPKPPQTVANEITAKHKAIDRVDDLATLGRNGGIFLRYPKLVVGVLPDGTGSRITVDSPGTGYSRYHSHVSGHWSSPSSNGWTSSGGASFRGGGPGSGK